MANFIEDMFNKLKDAGQKLEQGDRQTSWPKIQRVPHHLRDRKKFGKYYRPRLVSFGPIHYGKPHLRLGEENKHMWASMFLQANNKSAEDLHQIIQENIKNLRDLYTEDVIGEIDDEKLSGILFVDGCSLLQILQKFSFSKAEDLKVKVDQLALVRQDVMLLENQLPFLLLEHLTGRDCAMVAMDRFTRYFHLRQLNEPLHLRRINRLTNVRLTNTYVNLLRVKKLFSPKARRESNYEHNVPSPFPPPHLLHQLRNFMLDGFSPKVDYPNTAVTYRNVKELKEAGIRVQTSSSKLPMMNISFKSTLFRGQLRIPRLYVNDTIAPTYLNLIAYEMCPDFDNEYEISSYVQFLDSLIDHPDDVKELRAAGVLYNSLGSDEEVAELFNIISTDTVPTRIYADIRGKIEGHYKTKYKTWLAQAYHNYFNSPWTIIAFLAAFLVLLLTAAQTWITVFPRNSTSN